VAPDLNVLLAASRTDHPQHTPALRWLEQAIADCATGGAIEVLPMVAAGFLRLATNPRVGFTRLLGRNELTVLSPLGTVKSG
jgi:uncharacterized protein